MKQADLVFRSDVPRKKDSSPYQDEPGYPQTPLSAKVSQETKSFSLFYNDLARWLFITMAFTGILSTGWFGIPLAPRYFLNGEIDLISGLFALLSALGTIWGIMAYVEFTRSANLV